LFVPGSKSKMVLGSAFYTDAYSSFNIEERGKGQLCAVFRNKGYMGFTDDEKKHFLFSPREVEVVFDEETLALHVAKLQKESAELSMSQAALAELRARNAGLAPT
jgi:hypothetical protein